MPMNLVEDVKVELRQDATHVHLVLLSAAGEAVAVLTPGHALAIADGLTESALEIAQNAGGTLN
jgi:hypothetical protein